ncbi:MAG: SpoIIE family protein phosphatase [Akkermansiaceae bacterium]|nr:SpoIIE family protein phosphatase [Armatimonadota bacterium]
MIATKPPNEEERLSALKRYDILDSPVEEAFDNITRLISHICDAPISVINLIDRDRQFFKSEVGLGVRETPLDTSLCAHAILQPGLMVVPDTTIDPRFSDNPLVTGDPRLRFYAGALLETSDGHALGTLCVLDYKTRELTTAQADALQILARQVMALLELRRRYAHEKNIAETLQRSMLLRPKSDQFPGWTVEATYDSAWAEAEVGGDFFDVFGLAGGSVALVVGDVAGKGLRAATRTAEAKYALRVYLRETASPAEAVSRLNTFLCETTMNETDDTFVALTVVVVDQDGATRATLAGSEAPLVRRADGGIEVISAGGMPVGVMASAEYSEETFQLGSGDLILILTDGITEARQRREFFGTEGVERVLREVGALPSLMDIAGTVVSEARAFANGTLRDDVCLLLARRN